MPLLDDCEELFETRDLYKIFTITTEKSKKSLTESKLKKLYYKLALQYHPDKNTDKSKNELEKSTKKFQILGKIHKIFSSQEQKDLYDETGEVIEEGSEEEKFGKTDPNQEWSDYWRTLYPKVTIQKLEKLEKEYKNSKEELEDLKTAYNTNEGDMDKIMDSIMFSRFADESRFADIFNSLIQNKEVKSFKNFTNESPTKKSNRKKRYMEEEEEAVEHEEFLKKEKEKEEEGEKFSTSKSRSKKSKTNKAAGDFDLVAMLEKRSAERRVQGEAFLADLEARYCKPTSKKKAKK